VPGHADVLATSEARQHLWRVLAEHVIGYFTHTLSMSRGMLYIGAYEAPAPLLGKGRETRSHVAVGDQLSGPKTS
jgi:hypothetical protein